MHTVFVFAFVFVFGDFFFFTKGCNFTLGIFPEKYIE
jgi:hypothetical protein